MNDKARADDERADEDSTELAVDRTNLAEDRTVLAHERSFASWLRTGLAAVGIGIGFNALFRSVDPTLVAKAIASAFFVIAVGIFYFAQRRAATVIERLHPHEVETLRPVRARLISWALIVATIALGAAMWLLIRV